jgi:nucleotidyltransferase/DNA polymerase involved in DNA repair
VFALSPDETTAFLRGVPVAEVPGVGPRTLELLDGLGVTVVGDVFAVPERVLTARLGAAAAAWLVTVARNADVRPVVPAGRSGQIGVSRTFECDAPSSEMAPVFDEVLGEALRRLQRDDRSAGAVVVRFGLPDGSAVSASARLASPTRNLGLLAQTARGLSSRAPSGALRLLGVSFTGLTEGEQLLLDGLVDAPSFTVPERPPLSLLDRAFHGMPVRHPVFGEGVLLAVLEEEPRPALTGDPFCLVRFDRERVVLSSHLSATEPPSEH